MDYTTDACNMTRISVTGTTVITSGFANIVGIAFAGSATGSVQFFAGVTTSASLTPVITYSVTATALAGFLRFPCAVSGSGFTVKVPATLDPNLLLFWSPVQST